VKYAWIEGHQDEFSINAMCEFLNVSRSAYYDWLARTPTALEQEDAELIEVIKELFKQGRENYGTRCLKKALKQKGWYVSRRRIARLMHQAGLACKTKRKFKATTDSKHDLPVAPNLLDRQFSAAQPNQKYVGDITYIHTQEGWLYLAVVIDLFSIRAALARTNVR
jgi:putative transposase